MSTSVALYTRLSKDESGTQTATKRQEIACRTFADLRGWEVAEVYEDVDLSAYRREVHRPSYERLLLALRGGQIGGVVVWKLDRLVRRPAEFERFWEAAERSGAILASASEPIDTSNELGLALVRILVSFAGLESATLGHRIRAKMSELAQAGQAPSRIGFGYRRDPVRIVAKEATLIREAAERVLGGASLRSVALDWNTRGIPGPRGDVWYPQTLKRLLCSERLVGDRAYRGEVVARDCWPAILDRRTSERLQRKFPAAAGTGSSQRRVHLLTGLALCGRCGTRLQGIREHGTAAYRCPQAPSGCNGIQINAKALDAHVLEATCAHLGDLRASGPTPGAPRGSTTRVAKEGESRLRDMADDYYVHRLISRDEYVAYRSTVLDGRTPGLDARHLRREWPDLSLPARREQLDLVIRRIVIRPARYHEFDPRRVVIEWITMPSEQTPAPRMVSTVAAARVLGVDSSTVSRWIRDGKMTGERLGRSYFVTEAELKRQCWTVSKAAARIGVDTSTVFRWIREGRISTGRFGGAMVVSHDQVEKMRRSRASGRTAG